jgi:hypothetical protein
MCSYYFFQEYEYVCCVCNAHFPTELSVKNHIKIAHLLCLQWGEKSVDLEALKNHVDHFV